jgi:Cytidine and deoxycytidylate deaminase zinc-binding region
VALKLNGPCAKQVVFCEIHTIDGDTYIGSNHCRNPQLKCPREPGEGYDKCKTICNQFAHAEVSALNKALEADANLILSHAIVYGHTRCCEDCQNTLKSNGVNWVMIHDTGEVIDLIDYIDKEADD